MRVRQAMCGLWLGLFCLFLTDIAAPATAQEGLGTYLVNNSAAPSPDGVSGDLPQIQQEVMTSVLDYAYPDMTARWKSLSVAVCWENPAAASAADRQIVQRAATESWQAHSKLTFVGWETCTSDTRGIRIGVADVGPHTKGIGSRLNGKPNGMMLNFTFRNWGTSCASPEQRRRDCIYTIAVHEFGHAIGFSHEQNRPDTPNDECHAKSQGPNGTTTQLTAWDPSSTMNYCNPSYGNKGVLSKLDIYAVGQLYGTP